MKNLGIEYKTISYKNMNYNSEQTKLSRFFVTYKSLYYYLWLNKLIIFCDESSINMDTIKKKTWGK